MKTRKNFELIMCGLFLGLALVGVLELRPSYFFYNGCMAAIAYWCGEGNI